MEKKISQLVEITNIDNTTFIPVVQNVSGITDNFKITPTNFNKDQYYYNATVKNPLGSGYYTASTARAVVPADNRRLGTILLYATAAGQWTNEQFIGSNVSGWATDANWLKLGIVEGDINNRVTSLEDFNDNLIVGSNASYGTLYGSAATNTQGNDAAWTSQDTSLSYDTILNSLTIDVINTGQIKFYVLDAFNTVLSIDLFDITSTGTVTVNPNLTVPANSKVFITGNNVIKFKPGSTYVSKYFSTTNAIVGTSVGLSQINNQLSLVMTLAPVAPKINNDYLSITNELGYSESLLMSQKGVTENIVSKTLIETSDVEIVSNIVNLLNSTELINGEKIWENQYPLTTQYFDYFDIEFIGTNIAFDIQIYTNKLGTFTLIDTVTSLANTSIQKFRVNKPVDINCRIAIFCDSDSLKYNSNSGIGLKSYNLTTFAQLETLNSYELAYNIYFYTSLVNVEKQIDNKLSKIHKQLVDEYNYITLDNQLSGWTLSNFTLTNNTLVSSTTDAYCNLNKIYHTDKRYIRFDVTVNPTTTFIKIPCTWGTPSSGGEGASCFGVDFVNKKLIMYKVGDGSDTQYTSSSFTSVILNSTAIPDSTLLNNDYIIELHKNGLEHILILKNKTNCENVILSHTGWGVGRQNEKYNLQLISGSITIKSASVYAMNNPDIVFVGDSITEGVYVYDRTQRYAELFRTNNPYINVVISARGGDTISGILAKFATEYNIYKPKAMSVLIGANGGNTAQNLNQLKAACDAINCKLYLNYRTAQSGSIDGNATIAGLNLPGARFDLSTSINYDPVQGINTSLYADGGLHPNILGNQYMYKRLSVDILDIFKKQ